MNKGTYSGKGLYAGYDKNHKEREALDFYSTPTEEVVNILEYLDYDFSGQTILEPCAGAGHMLQGITNYLEQNDQVPKQIIATDIKNRGNVIGNKIDILSGADYDVLSDTYAEAIGCSDVDWVIMNPPFSVIEPFVLQTLKIAHKGVIMLGRIQFAEGEKRYETVIRENPPTAIYAYVDRIQCYKNGTIDGKPPGPQMYAWFVWDNNADNSVTEFHWIRRANKKSV